MNAIRFNLRDLLWLMVVAGLSVGWWCDSRREIDANLSAEVVDLSGDLVEISAGSDDGLKLGYCVKIYRGKTYLGEAIVRKMSYDSAVVQRSGKSARIQKGDTVVARIVFRR